MAIPVKKPKTSTQITERQGIPAVASLLPGRHLLADLDGVEPHLLDDAALFERLLGEAVATSGLHPMSSPVLVRFPGGGLTGFVVLAESHIAFHSYPDLGFLALDIFTCGKADPQRALVPFLAALQPARHAIRTVERGQAPAQHPA